VLTRTLILPESDARLAVRMLRDAIDRLDIVLMLVLGKDDRATQIVEWADKLAKKTATPDGNLRGVVWIRNLETRSIRDALAELVDDPLPRVIVLNFFDQVKAELGDADTIEPLDLEMAFLKGHQS